MSCLAESSSFRAFKKRAGKEQKQAIMSREHGFRWLEEAASRKTAHLKAKAVMRGWRSRTKKQQKTVLVRLARQCGTKSEEARKKLAK